MSGESMIDRFSETRDWSTSACRAISWHPNANKLALAANDDCRYALTPLRVGNSDYRALFNFRTGVQHVFHFFGINVFSSRNDHIFEPVHNK